MADKCILQDRDCINCGECDICDLDPNKRCDDCGKCLESDVDDYRSLYIEDFLKQYVVKDDQGNIKVDESSQEFNDKDNEETELNYEGLDQNLEDDEFNLYQEDEFNLDDFIEEDFDLDDFEDDLDIDDIGDDESSMHCGCHNHHEHDNQHHSGCHNHNEHDNHDQCGCHNHREYDNHNHCGCNSNQEHNGHDHCECDSNKEHDDDNLK